jgi:hypothetical protein
MQLLPSASIVSHAAVAQCQHCQPYMLLLLPFAADVFG